jgi:hypothetical protein
LYVFIFRSFCFYDIRCPYVSGGAEMSYVQWWVTVAFSPLFRVASLAC